LTRTCFGGPKFLNAGEKTTKGSARDVLGRTRRETEKREPETGEKRERGANEPKHRRKGGIEMKVPVSWTPPF